MTSILAHIVDDLSRQDNQNGHLGGPDPRSGDQQTFGLITRGSLSEGLTLKLEPGWTVEGMRVGRFVVIEGADHRFFCLITDMELGATNDQILLDPPRYSSFARQALEGIITYGSVSVQPMLMLPKNVAAGDEASGPGPVRTIPVHFSPVRTALDDDFATVFGQEDAMHFAMGRPLDMDAPVCINLERLIERSNGVFGKSGTGKSFLTRLLLCGVIRSDIASTLVFDMHSEYGWQTQSEEGGSGEGRILPGLRRLFGPKVHVYSLDRESSRARGVQVDGYLDIGLNQIDIEDIALLQEELGFSSAMVDTCYLLRSRWGNDWLKILLESEPAALANVAEQVGGHTGSLSAIFRKLSQIGTLPFVKGSLDESQSVIDEMMGWLERGEHVVLEFGRHRKPLVYMLVANIITRRIYAAWVDKTEVYLQTKQAKDRPRRLVLVIEEAHKFLNPRAARNTSFGTIAREMRKYNVTLLVVDQRPSGIDPEVASQLGTRVTALLTEENDIRTVFSGVPGAEQLRTVLASLDTKKQALIVGHAVPMPVVIRVREYDQTFFGQMSGQVRGGRPTTPTTPTPVTTPKTGAAGLLEAFGIE